MSYGTYGVDWETRVDFDKLRKERLARAKEQLKESNLGSLICFDPSNIRYITSTWLHWGTEKHLTRYCVLPKGAEPFLFEIGAAAMARKEPHGAPWLGDRVLPAVTWGRGAVPREVKAAERCVSGVKKVLMDYGVADEPVGLDIFDVPLMNAVQNAGLQIADGQEVMLNARCIKSEGEIELLKTAASQVDAAYSKVRNAIRPGVRENDLVALVHQTLYSMGADDVENVNCISGPRTNPHHHDWSDRALRPGDLVFLDIQSRWNGYITCYYRTFSCGEPTKEQKDLNRDCVSWLKASIDAVRPGATTADIAKAWPGPEVLGFKTEQEALANQWGHGIGLSLWELPVISRAFSLDHPFPIKKNMVFALETYAGKLGQRNGVRIEDEVVVTDSGCEVITTYPRDELIACPL
jgi:Xaa-Pro dipeptidase